MKKLLMTASSWGHIVSFHLPYLTAMEGLGWQVHLGCANPPEQVEGVAQVHQLPFEKRMTSVGNLKITYKLWQMMRREGYDLIICHTSLAAFFTRLAVLGLRRRPRVINMVHGYLFNDTTPPLKKAIMLGAEKVTAPVTHRVLTMNQWDTHTAQAHRLAKEVEYVPGIGVPTLQLQGWRRDEALRRQLGLVERDTLLIYPAEFSKRKNHAMLIRAMAELPTSVHLVLPGRGALLEDCRGLAETLNLSSRIHFPGFVTDLPRWYGIADIGVTVSRSEGLPFNVMEGMICGLPMVVSGVKGHVDLIEEGRTGLRFPLEDRGRLVTQILRLVEDAPLRRQLGQAGQVAAEGFALAQVQPVVLRAYGLSE